MITLFSLCGLDLNGHVLACRERSKEKKEEKRREERRKRGERRERKKSCHINRKGKKRMRERGEKRKREGRGIYRCLYIWLPVLVQTLPLPNNRVSHKLSAPLKEKKTKNECE
jgi:hypothetical protein